MVPTRRSSSFYQAADCLEEAIAGRISDNEVIPEPSLANQGNYLVYLPAQMAALATLYHAMRRTSTSQVELAKRLNSDEKEIST